MDPVIAITFPVYKTMTFAFVYISSVSCSISITVITADEFQVERLFLTSSEDDWNTTSLQKQANPPTEKLRSAPLNGNE